ncbi:MAG: restriction endonuclease subunit S [Smithella sp.]
MLLKMINFRNAVVDATGGQYKVLKRDYLSEGRIPVIDQGQAFIAGYANNDDAIFTGKLPVVLFGDHTLALKYVDFPFALGADGVKVLSINNALEPKYVYYYWQSCAIQSRGYSRHFKYLRDVQIPLIPISEQRRIVEILDQADALRKKRSVADAKAARILPALFYKMFGDPATNPKGWPVAPIGEMVTPIERRDPSDQPEKTFTYIDIAGVDGQLGVISGAKTMIGEVAPSRARQIVKTNDVIISTVRPYLRATALVPAQYDNQICSTGFCVLRANAGIGFGFLYVLSRVQWFTVQLNARARGASYPAVTDADICNLRVLRPYNQDILKSFDFQVLDALALLGKRREATRRLEDLFEMILHHAFTGDLTAKWREVHMKELLHEMEQQVKSLNLRMQA